MKHSLCLFLFLLGQLPLSVSAQWAWTDKDGRQVYSDRAPPVGVPDKRIFKRPGRASNPIVQDAIATADPVAPAAKASTPALPGALSAKAPGVDKELAEKKKKEEQVQAALRKAEEERINQAKAENCQRAKQAQKGLESGIRLSRINNQGEREVMDDAARAAEAKRIQSVVDSDCK